MSFRLKAKFLPLLLVVAGCSAAPASESDTELVAEEGAGIVRGQVDTSTPQVMALYIPNIDGTETLCSGTLYAKRTLVTAAHCLQNAGLVFAYHGNDYWADFEEIFEDPSLWTHWSMSTQWKLHPGWNPSTLSSDIAVVHLDRDPPFAPLPLAIKPVTDMDLGKAVQIVGYGATGTDPTGTQGVDAYVRRSGQTAYQGFPVVRPLPTNPHPGIGDRSIRKQLMQLKGTAPSANSCYGDSGGPALMRSGGKAQLVGVASWTGDFCESFSYYVRTYDYLPFLAKSVAPR